MADSTTFDLYMKNLSKIKRLSNEEQRTVHETLQSSCLVGSHRADLLRQLQGQALLLVAHVFKRMQINDRLSTVEAFDMDAIQEANLAALTALPQWEPVRGTLATWLVPHIKGSLLDYANTHTNGGIGSKHNKLVQVASDEVIAQEELSEAQDMPGVEDSVPITLGESLTYDGDVLPNAERETFFAQIREHAWLVRNGNLLTDHYIADLSIKDLAVRYNTSQDTIRRRLAQAQKDLRNAIDVGHDWVCGVC